MSSTIADSRNLMSNLGSKSEHQLDVTKSLCDQKKILTTGCLPGKTNFNEISEANDETNYYYIIKYNDIDTYAQHYSKESLDSKRSRKLSKDSRGKISELGEGNIVTSTSKEKFSMGIKGYLKCTRNKILFGDISHAQQNETVYLKYCEYFTKF